MKTAEQYAIENGCYKTEDTSEICGYCEFGAEGFMQLVKEIQLDAFKAGMTRAAEIAKGDSAYHAHGLILSARDNMKEI